LCIKLCFYRRDLLFRTLKGNLFLLQRFGERRRLLRAESARDFGLHMTSARGGEIFLEIRDLCLQRLRLERLLQGALFGLSNCRVLFMHSGARLDEKLLCSL
jgi:hypothetical protein